MGSVRHRLSEARHDCNVVLVGDVRVGKSALVNRWINNKFTEVSFLPLDKRVGSMILTVGLSLIKISSYSDTMLKSIFVP